MMDGWLPAGLLVGAALLLGGCASSAESSPGPAASEQASSGAAAWSAASGTPSDEQAAYAQRAFIRGLTRVRLGEPRVAIQHYESALEVTPEAPAILSALAEALAERGELSAALFNAQEARRLAPRQPYYGLQVARLYLAEGQPAEALVAYEALFDRFPDGFSGQWAARRALARLYAEQGRPRQALDAYETLAAVGAPSPTLLAEMLPLYRTAGDTAATARTLEALLRASSGAAAPQRTQKEDYRRALARLRTADDASTAEPAGAGAAATAENLVARARPFYRQALDGAAGAAGEAAALLAQAVERDASHAEALALLGRLRFESGAFAEAAALLKRSLDVDPRAPRRWARTAEAYLRADRPAEAAAVADEGLLLFPGQVPLLDAYATALQRTGRPAEAARHFEEALRLLDADGLLATPSGASRAARFHDALARYYDAEGQAAEATRHRRQAQALRER